MKISATQLGRELRHGSGNFLEERRTAAALTILGMASLGVIALYQVGVIKRLPEPPLPALDSETVNGSAQAYKLLNLPDAVLGLGSYAATLGLVTMGGKDRWDTHPWLPLALAAKVGADTLQAATLTHKSWVCFRTFSLYSLFTALATCAALPTILPEARAAWRRLTGH
jgi:hypothetical protein